jgi:hypothetical protein
VLTILPTIVLLEIGFAPRAWADHEQGLASGLVNSVIAVLGVVAPAGVAVRNRGPALAGAEA